MDYNKAQSLINILQNSPIVEAVRPTLKKKLLDADLSKPVLVAISGESASGKSALMDTIKHYLPNATYLSTDNYFKDFSDGIALHGSFDALLAAGYAMQAPYSIHLDILRQNLLDLKASKDVKIPQHLLDGSGKTILNVIPVKSSDFVFVDGFCTLYDEVRDLFDFAVYLEVDHTIQKNIFFELSNKRNATEEQAKRIFKILSVSSDIYIKPTKEFADIVLNLLNDETQSPILIKKVISCLSGHQLQVETLSQKLSHPKGDLALLWHAISPTLQKKILKELNEK